MSDSESVQTGQNDSAGLASSKSGSAYETPGAFVVLLGPDGAGKSSVVKAVQHHFAPKHAAVFHFSPAILHSRSEASADASSPHIRPPRSWAFSVLKALYWLAEYTLGYYWTVRPAVAASALVLFDRYLLDALVDPRRYRYSGPTWLLELVWGLVPKPDLVILLDAPPEVLQQRKQEVEPEESARQREAYRLLVQGLPYARIIDATEPLERVVARVAELISALGDRGSPNYRTLAVRHHPGLQEHSLNWIQVLDPGFSVQPWQAPEEFGSALGTHAERSWNTLMGWRSRTDDLPDLSSYRALVLFEPRGVSADWLQAHGFQHVRNFAVIPNVSEARWLFPLRAKRSAAHGWDLYNPQTCRARLAKLVARWTTRALGPGLFGARLSVAQRSISPLEVMVGDALGTRNFTLSIAPHWPGPRSRLAGELRTEAGRALVYAKHRVSIQVCGHDGSILAYAKLTSRPGAVCALEREARFTDYVVGLGLKRVVVPRLLRHGPLGQGYMVITTPVDTLRRHSPSALTPAHFDLLAELMSHRTTAVAGELLDRLTARLTALRGCLQRRWGDLLDAALLTLRSLPTFASLPVALSHGDFTPWNLKLERASRRFAAFDWERGQREQFLLWDAFHFRTQVDMLLRARRGTVSARSTIVALSRAKLTLDVGISPQDIGALLVAYLAGSSLEWFEEHRDPSGGPIAVNSPDQEMRREMLEAVLPSLGVGQDR